MPYESIEFHLNRDMPAITVNGVTANIPRTADGYDLTEASALIDPETFNKAVEYCTPALFLDEGYGVEGIAGNGKYDDAKHGLVDFNIFGRRVYIVRNDIYVIRDIRLLDAEKKLLGYRCQYAANGDLSTLLTANHEATVWTDCAEGSDFGRSGDAGFGTLEPFAQFDR